MNQEDLIQASFIEREAKEVQEKLSFVEQQIIELETFKENLMHLDSVNEKEMLSSLGKGVFIKTEIKDKKLFVNVGHGILVRKTASEAQHIIENQIKTFHEARIALEKQLQILNSKINQIIAQFERENTHSHQ